MCEREYSVREHYPRTFRQHNPRTFRKLGGHYFSLVLPGWPLFFFGARMSQFCFGAEGLFLVAGTKKSWPEVLILAQINFSEASDFFPDPSFWTPGKKNRGPKLCANCAQTVRKVCGDFQNPAFFGLNTVRIWTSVKRPKNRQLSSGKLLFFRRFFAVS